MSDIDFSTLPDEVKEIYLPDGGGTPDSTEFEPEEPDDAAAFINSIILELIERVIPEPKRVLTIEKAAKCLSLLGKIWNLTECPEGCEIDSMRCETSDERLLDMEGYVEEYQYLHLEATDLALSDIRVIPLNFIWLLSVDVSGNRLTNITACPLTRLPNAVSIKLNRNRIEDPYMEPMKHLQYLGMNSNKIYSLHRIYHPNLMTLDLNWNKIRQIDPNDCWKLKKLKQLELRGNHLTTIAGIEYERLEVLYLADNGISRIEGMQILVNLRRLHLRNNPLQSLSGFTDANSKLEYLNVRSCKIPNLEDVKNLQVLTGLSVLIVKGNPLSSSFEDFSYESTEDESESAFRIQILRLLPHLKRLDKKPVSSDEVRRATAEDRDSEQ